jgi:hypothetical protein
MCAYHLLPFDELLWRGKEHLLGFELVEDRKRREKTRKLIVQLRALLSEEEKHL